MATLEQIAAFLLPPFVSDIGKRARNKWRAVRPGAPPAEWEYVPEGWERQANDSRIAGWNVPGVLETYKAKWPAFVGAVEGKGPLGVSHEASVITHNSHTFHNILMAYAYVLALASRNKSFLSMLDWGGGIGHYYLIGRAVLPEGVQLEYHCKDVPILCEYGRELFPEAHFHDDESFLERPYDLVMASTSLQYSQEWCRVLGQLASLTGEYLYVTRLPVVFQEPSFVVLQRAYAYGYDTEYLGWFLNRDEFLECAASVGMNLVREFLIEERIDVPGAPEAGVHRGYLFQPNR